MGRSMLRPYKIKDHYLAEGGLAIEAGGGA